jgi:hypothetical protein
VLGEPGAAAAKAASGEGEKEEGDISERSEEAVVEVRDDEGAMGTGLDTDLCRGGTSRLPMPLPLEPKLSPPPPLLLPPPPPPELSGSTHEKSTQCATPR